MREDGLSVRHPACRQDRIPLTMVHTLVVGSGAAGLNAAVQLRAAGIDDVLIVSEGLAMGTSINTGSDKQTYYKLSLYGQETDSPVSLAETFFAGGSMHGDLAMVEASLSARAFLHLVDLGVPFPRDTFGQFVGYRTDHDPRQRATSIGPYTSREMCRALIRRIGELGIPVRENRNAVALLTVDEPAGPRAAGAVFIDAHGRMEVVGAENVIFAVGGPGGLYRTRVYPTVHTGAIGLALLAGARAQNLPESQFGLASTPFPWNVSGSYMQVVPRIVSTAADGRSDPQEFLRPYFPSAGAMHSFVFLKGYQWPFDSRKAIGGSSLVDVLVYQETSLRGRRVFLDFRRNPDGFAIDDLSDEARTYLTRSQALGSTPLDRLRAMNPGAVELYMEHGIDLAAEPLEIAVCAQHNNGGLAGNVWWESASVSHLFPVGEVNGSHGVYRPGGAALNAGQVGGFRAAEYIAARYREPTLAEPTMRDSAHRTLTALLDWLALGTSAETTWQAERDEFQQRMTRDGAHIRSLPSIDAATEAAWKQWTRLGRRGCRFAHRDGSTETSEAGEALRVRQLCFAHAVYLDAIRFWVSSGVGSRGSAVVLDPDGTKIHECLDDQWRIASADPAFSEQVLETQALPDGRVEHRWVARRPLPVCNEWFETAWARYRRGEIHDNAK